jgi:hypothetical protein
LAAAEKAMQYYRSFVKEFNVYGGPHDIFKSPDEEGILAFIKLHTSCTGIPESRNSGGPEGRTGYEFSWKFAYNTVPELEPLKSKNGVQQAVR